jgi:Uma2 family endonuclease
MAAEPRRNSSRQDYLALERQGAEKHEYIDGAIIAMVGASFRHNLIQTRILAALYARLRGGPCEALPSDLRVAIPPLGIYTYPDITVVCGEPHFEDSEQDTLLNPLLIVEILLPSTEGYDRGLKFQRYRPIPTLREYVLIAQDWPTIEYYLRPPDDRWILSTYTSVETPLTLRSCDCTLALGDIYTGIAFEPD